MLGDLRAETVTFAAPAATRSRPTRPVPLDGGPRGGVVVIHHMPGYDEATKEIARRFAAHGYNGGVPNLYWREAPGADARRRRGGGPGEGGVPDERLLGDVAGAAAHLRALPGSNGKVGVIGYCSGGRQSFLAARSPAVDAVVDCYGAFVDRHRRPTASRCRSSRSPTGSASCAARCSACSARRTSTPRPSTWPSSSRRSPRPGKTFEFHSYEGAGHSFFAVDRPAYRPEAATDGWRRILDFYGRHLAA